MRDCVLVAFGVFSLACSHVINVPLDDLPRVAKYHEQEETLISIGEEEVLVTAGDAPEVRIQRDCSFWSVVGQDCQPDMGGPLKSLRFDGTHYHFDFHPARGSCFHLRGIWERSTPTSLKVEEVTGAGINLTAADYVPRNWEPTAGFGMGFAGPSRAATLNLQGFVAPWLVLEGGILPASHLLAVFAGFRLRPLKTGPVRYFAGAFVNYMGGCSPSPQDDTVVQSGRNTDESECFHSSVAGSRLGLDWQFYKQRWMLTAEFNVVHPLDELEDDEFPTDQDGEWILWGGGSIVYLFGD